MYFVLGAGAAAVVAVVVLVFRTVEHIRILRRRLQDLEMHLEDAFRDIDRVEDFIGNEAERVRDALERDVTELRMELDSRLDKLYDRIMKERA